MAKLNRKYILFIIIWLGVLDYLILSKSVFKNYLLAQLSEPFGSLLTGRVIGSGPGGNPLLVLILANVIIAILFYMTFVKLEGSKKTRN